MRKNKQITKSKKRVLLTSLLLSASALATFAACDEDQVSIGYKLPTDTTIEVGVEYKPVFDLEDGVTATIVDLLQPRTSNTLMKDGGFTPDVTGEYKYVVRFKQVKEGRVYEAQETVTVKAIDTVAPVFNAIADKTVETGLYTGFGDDISAITVTDNCAQVVNVYAESITFNGVTTTLDAGVTEVRLPDIGEYTVKVVAEDFSGNKTTATYKMTAQDTKAPVIDTQLAITAWATEGKVAVPTPNVIDNATYTLETAVADAEGNPVTIVDGKIDATEGVYTVTYTAQDSNENEATATMKLIVKEAGVITDFANEGEDLVWDGDGLRVENEKLEIYNVRVNAMTMQYVEGFTVGDWSDYTALTFGVENHRGAKLSVTPYFLVDGEWKETAVHTVDGEGSSLVTVYLADYDLENVQGIRFGLACDEGIIASIDEIKLSTEEDDRAIPEASELTGLGGGVYAITAKGIKEIALNTTNTQGVVAYEIYANVACDVMIGLLYENGAVYSNKTLQAGWNTVLRYPDAESGQDLVSSELKTMTISNFENYDIDVRVKGVTFADIGDIDVSAYAITEGSYSVDYAEVFHIPTPFTSSMRWYKNLKIEIFDAKGYPTGLRNLVVGDAIETEGDNALKPGTYEIRYVFNDLAGKKQTISYSLTVKANALTINFTMPALFNNPEGFELPTPTITSSEYGDAEVQANATIEKSYRLQGRRTWTTIEDGQKFTPESNRTYEIRYVVKYTAEDGSTYHREYIVEKFIHVNDTTLDFEPEDAVGEDQIIRYKVGDTLPDGTVAKTETYFYEKSRFLHDGGGYDYRPDFEANRWTPSSDWSVSGKTSLTQFSPGTRGWSGFVINPVVSKENITAVRFWMKADKDHPGFQMEVGAGPISTTSSGKARPYAQNGWRACEPFDLKAGVHQYTVYLQEPIKPFESAAVVDFIMMPGNRLYIDDLEFLSIKRLEAVDSNTYEDQIDNTEGYELTKPEVSSDLLTPEELAKVSYVLTYSLNGKDPVELLPDADGKYILKLTEEKGEVVFKWTIKGVVDGQEITRTFESDIVSIGVVPLDVAHEEIYLKDASATLSVAYGEADVTDVKFDYKKYADTEWTTATDMTFPTDTVGWYDIRITAKTTHEGAPVEGLYLSSIYVRDPSVFIDFEGSDPVLGGDYYGHGYNGPQYDWSDYVRDENGNTSLKILNVMQAWEGVYFGTKTPRDLGGEFNTVKVRVHSSINYSGYRFGIWWTPSEYNEKMAVDLKAGWNDVYLVYDRSFSQLIAFYGKISTNAGFPAIMIDDISFLTIDFESATPTTAIYGDEVSLPNASCDGVDAKISYRLEGTDVWTDVVENKFTTDAVGKYEVRYAFEGMFDYIIKVDVSLNVSGVDSLTANANFNDAVTVPAVTATVVEDTYTAKAYYRVKGTEEWLEVVDATFKATDKAGYEVLFDFEEIGLNVMKEVAVNMTAQGLSDLVSNVNFKDTVTVPTVTANELTAKAEYRAVGDNEWTEVVDGSFVADSVKGYEVRFTFESLGVEFIKTVTTVMTSPDLDAVVQKVSYGMPFTVPASVTLGGETSTGVSYRIKGDEDWEEFDSTYSLRALYEEGYEIRYEFSTLEAEVIKSVEVLAKGVVLLHDFETPFDRTNVTTYLYMNYWNDTYKTSGMVDYCNIEKEANGNSVLRIHASQGWDGPYWKGGIDLGFKPTQIKFKAKTLNVASFQIYAMFTKDGQYPSYHEPKLTLDTSKTVDLGDGWYEYTLIVPQNNCSSVLRCLEFRCYGSVYYVDDIYAIDGNA